MAFMLAPLYFTGRVAGCWLLEFELLPITNYQSPNTPPSLQLWRTKQSPITDHPVPRTTYRIPENPETETSFLFKMNYFIILRN
jgi:hypothetical protein